MASNFRLVITKQGKEPLKFIRDIQLQFYAEMQERLKTISEETVEQMRKIIKENKKRENFGNNLEEAWTADLLDDVGGIHIGIGNIARLKALAPYYEVLNYGGYIPYSTRKGAPLGSYYGDAPNKTATPTQNWERAGKGFFMKPKKPIDGISYIEISVQNLLNKLETETKNWVVVELNKTARG